MRPGAIKLGWITSFCVAWFSQFFINPTRAFYIGQGLIQLGWFAAWRFRCRHWEHDLLNVYTRDGLYLYSKLMCIRCHQVFDVPAPKGPQLCK